MHDRLVVAQKALFAMFLIILDRWRCALLYIRHGRWSKERD